MFSLCRDVLDDPDRQTLTHTERERERERDACTQIITHTHLQANPMWSMARISGVKGGKKRTKLLATRE